MRFSRTNLNIAETYLLANKVILIIIALVIMYPLFTLYFDFGFPCQHKLYFGSECRSCGLTRGLQSCLQFDFSAANAFNKQSTFVFLVFVSQIVFRLFILLFLAPLILKRPSNVTLISLIDLTTIIALFAFNLFYYG